MARIVARIPGAPRNRRLRRVWTVGWVVIVGLALLVGVLVLVVGALTNNFGDGDHPGGGRSGTPSHSQGAGGSREAVRQDAIAGRPMATLPLSAAQPQPLATVPAGAHLRIPVATVPAGVGGAPIASGFPRTPEGAVGQLAAIDEVVLSSLRPELAAEVYRWAAAPGAPSLSGWTMSVDVTDLLRGTTDADTVAGSYQVSQAQIKGTVGAGWAAVCVLGEMDLTVQVSARAGVGDCQRMAWQAGRWRIGAGRQAAAAPDAWPASADAYRAGWRDIDHG